MKHTNPDGTEFDFTRVPVAKLVEYFISRNTNDHDNLQYGGTEFPVIREIIEAARVPRERKEDVARELLQACSFLSEVEPHGGNNDIYEPAAVNLRRLASRYRKAV